MNEMKRYGWLLAMLLFTIPSFVALIRPGIQSIQDNMQYFRVYEMDICLADGQIPCRWVPDMGYGFGYPLFLYYSPGPYYLGAGLHALGWQYIDVIKLEFIAGFILSGLAMYWLISSLFKSGPLAFIGSLIYIYVPVRAVEVYVRGSLGEFLAMIFFPLLFVLTYRIIRKIGKYNILWFGLAISGMFLTHNLMSIAMAPFLTAWIVYWSLVEKSKDAFKKIGIGLLIGLGLSAFYVLPLILERSYVHLESMTGGYFGYQQHFVSLYQLFISNYWGYGSSQLGLNDGISLSVGQIQWLFSILAVILAITYYKKHKDESKTVFLLAGLGLFSLFMVHQRSEFIWSNVPLMKYFQFPWRFLVSSAFLLSLTSVYGLSFVKDKYRKLFIVVILMSLFGLYGRYFKPVEWLVTTDKELLGGDEFTKQQTASIFDYLPVSAFLPPNYKALPVPEIFDGEGTIDNYQKRSDDQMGVITIESIEAKVRIPLFDFPGMTVTDNGVKIYFDHSDCRNQDYCFGQISFKLKKGIHQIRVNLGSTPPRVAGDLISLLTFIVLAVVLVKRNSWFG